jgi:uncharacterized membrane protein required for colicin V production
MLDFFNQFNWIDILVFVIFLRVFYISLRNGLPAEFFKILGTGAALYLSLHYYSTLAKFAAVRFNNKNPPIEVFAFAAFLILSLIGYLLFMLLRLLAERLVKTEINPELSKWLGLAVGLLRTLFLSSVILFTLRIFPVTYFSKSINKSYSGAYLVKVAPTAYTWFWHNIAAKFMTGEKYNKSVNSVLELKSKP